MFTEKKKKKKKDKDVYIFAFSVFATICFNFYSINALPQEEGLPEIFHLPQEEGLPEIFHLPQEEGLPEIIHLPQEEGLPEIIHLPQKEVDALEEFAATLGSRFWKFDTERCKVEIMGLTETPPLTAQHDVKCNCNLRNKSDCHITSIKFKDHNLPGTLPQIVNLPYLQEIDLAYNYINGTIPREWAFSNVTYISLLVNRLSGEIPKEIGNALQLRYLDLESNGLSGTIPQELGNLVNLKTLLLSSNKFTGNLPASLVGLTQMVDFRINDLQLSGPIPSYIQNWKGLRRLEMIASGLSGPIPATFSDLRLLFNLRISDIDGPVQPFPPLKNANILTKLILKNCNISGEIPAYVQSLANLETLDLSFNRLVGKIPSFAHAERLRFIILTSNMLEGDTPDELLRDGLTIDLSYNNLKWQSPESPSCRPNLNLNLNMFQSTSTKKSFLPCIKDFKCSRYSTCLHVNCGGSDIYLKDNKTKELYEGDGEVEGGAATFYMKPDANWGFSSSGDYMDDNNFQNTRYTMFVPESNMSDLYKTARIAPVSLTYFHACLENGNYTINLDFAEMRFTNDETYNRLGRRLFDIYIQEKLVAKDFNIMDKAKGAQKPIMQPFTANVTNHFLTIRFHWSGKGTTRIPVRGVYGPLISAISIVSDSKPCSLPKTRKSKRSYIAIGVGAPCLIIFILGILWCCGCLPCCQRRRDPYEDELPSGTFTLRQIKFATDDFDLANKIGEGGFGAVFKGVLADGRVVAVKQLSSKSRQGNREFLNEIGAISCLQHPYLVKLHGFCVERAQLLLVYEYMENNSLSNALFGPKDKQIPLDWPTRFKICSGIAKGLAFLHEESPLKFVHRDIKATNILLDKELTPKISDFGLARLDEEEKTHVSTKVAGTIGYMAPEYALWGYLSFKADVYSFGVLVLEIVAGVTNSNFMAAGDSVCLLEWANDCVESGHLMQVVDERLRPEVNKQEAEAVIKVALVCTSASPTDRPIMSEVVAMLEGLYPVPESNPGISKNSGDIRFKAFKDLRKEMENTSKTQRSVKSYPSSSSISSEAAGLVAQERKKEEEEDSRS